MAEWIQQRDKEWYRNGIEETDENERIPLDAEAGWIVIWKVVGSPSQTEYTIPFYFLTNYKDIL